MLLDFVTVVGIARTDLNKLCGGRPFSDARLSITGGRMFCSRLLKIREAWLSGVVSRLSARDRRILPLRALLLI